MGVRVGRGAKAGGAHRHAARVEPRGAGACPRGEAGGACRRWWPTGWALTIGLAAGPTGCATIAEAPPHAFVAPPAAPPPTGFSVCWVEYGNRRSWGQLVTAGWGEHGTFNATVSGLLLRHPRRHILLDAGNSAHFADEIADVPLATRLYLKNVAGAIPAARTAPEALRAVGEDPDLVASLLVSHVHPDHLGGLLDLPARVTVMMPERELYFLQRLADARSFAVVGAQADAVVGRARPFAFAKAPYETFDESADLFGDGSVVAVPLPGHTPGSVGVFLNVPGRRLFYIGDTAWSARQVTRRVGKSVFAAGTDDDHAATNAMVAKVAQLRELDPTLVILPAHDRDVYERYFGGTPGCTAPAGR